MIITQNGKSIGTLNGDGTIESDDPTLQEMNETLAKGRHNYHVPSWA
jgi:hypothetical protein